jgi:large subunit ribosomal protein L15
LGKLAYHIEKGNVDTTKPIQMKDLLDAGVISKVQDGVKILAKGVERFKSLGVALDIEVSDASKIAIETIKELGGSVSH